MPVTTTGWITLATAKNGDAYPVYGMSKVDIALIGTGSWHLEVSPDQGTTWLKFGADVSGFFDLGTALTAVAHSYQFYDPEWAAQVRVVSDTAAGGGFKYRLYSTSDA